MMKKRVAALGLLLIVVGSSSAAADVPGSADHPAVTRFRGSTIIAQTRRDFDAYVVPLGPADASEKKFKKQEDLEGKVTKTLYQAPAGSSPLAVYRSYETALRSAGFEILFSCTTRQCGQEGSLQNTLGYGRKYLAALEGRSLDDTASYLLTARQAKGPTYVVVVASHHYGIPANVFYTVDVVEVKPLQTGLAAVNAQGLADDLTRAGHAPVYGILFDTDQALIRPESKPVLDEIAKLLRIQPTMRLHVVGHTDNAGTFAHNMALSKQRADAVVTTLTGEYQIAPARLVANGVGPLAPVASNASEDGRARNRRVELVAQ